MRESSVHCSDPFWFLSGNDQDHDVLRYERYFRIFATRLEIIEFSVGSLALPLSFAFQFFDHSLVLQFFPLRFYFFFFFQLCARVREAVDVVARPFWVQSSSCALCSHRCSIPSSIWLCPGRPCARWERPTIQRNRSAISIWTTGQHLPSTRI